MGDAVCSDSPRFAACPRTKPAQHNKGSSDWAHSHCPGVVAGTITQTRETITKQRALLDLVRCYRRRLRTQGQGTAGLLPLDQPHPCGNPHEVRRAAGPVASPHGSDWQTRPRRHHDYVASGSPHHVQPGGCLSDYRGARAEPLRPGEACNGVARLPGAPSGDNA